MAIADAARLAGELVFAFDQDESEVLTAPQSSVKRGICLGMALQWVARPDDFEFDPRTRELLEPPWEAAWWQQIAQLNIVDSLVHPSESVVALFDECLVSFGLGIDAFWADCRPITADGLAQILATPPDLAEDRSAVPYLLSLRGRPNHAVALRATHAGPSLCAIDYLDSMYGSYRFSSPSRFARWFDGFWVESGYKAKFESGYTLTRVVPRRRRAPLLRTPQPNTRRPLRYDAKGSLVATS